MLFYQKSLPPYQPKCPPSGGSSDLPVFFARFDFHKKARAVYWEAARKQNLITGPGEKNIAMASNNFIKTYQVISFPNRFFLF